MRVPIALAVALAMAAAPAAAGEPPVGHKPTAWQKPAFSKLKGKVRRFADGYRRFIDAHRTEREVVAAARARAQKLGFRDLFGESRPPARPGSRLYAEVHGKLAAFVVVGSEPLSAGVHAVAAHIDAVRIDLKQTPVYADGNMALLQTHYYGGIKRYQWLSQPLALRGVVITRGGVRIDVAIGDDEDEPVLVIPDVAAHMTRYVDGLEGEDLPGESLDPIVSSTPARRSSDDPFAAEAARLLERELGIEVADLASAELELVPAAAVRYVGLDRGMIGGYGQDDRACAYAALRALFSVKRPKHTAIVILADKEEIGSTGNTGARSTFIRRVVAELLEANDIASTQVAVDQVLSSSLIFSADVTGAVNPHYRELYDGKNAAFVGSGVVWDQSAVHAEVLAYVRGLFDAAGVTHQPSDWGKTRGSRSERGTVLAFFTQHGMNGLDVSIPLLSMHSTYELISIADLYEAYRAYRALLAD